MTKRLLDPNLTQPLDKHCHPTMSSSVESIEDKKRRYSEELATYTLRQWETFHNQSAQGQAFAEQQRDSRKPPSSSTRSREGQVLCCVEIRCSHANGSPSVHPAFVRPTGNSSGEPKPSTRQTQIGKLLGKWMKGR